MYISETVSKPFYYYMENPEKNAALDWRGQKNYPRPDYLSSSRKRLAPQLIYKGGILHAWQKKMAVAVDSQFFTSLPTLEEVDSREAELAWLVYDLHYDSSENRRHLKLAHIVYTRFLPVLDKITRSEPGNVQDFIDLLQAKLDEVLAMGTSIGAAPDSVSLQDIVEME